VGGQQRPADDAEVDPHERAAGHPREPGDDRRDDRHRHGDGDAQAQPAAAMDGPRQAARELEPDRDRERPGEQVVEDEQPGRFR
jgi:hypothetical protein